MAKNRMAPTWILYNTNKKEKSFVSLVLIPIEEVDVWDSLG